jgi:hypothetical protein
VDDVLAVVVPVETDDVLPFEEVPPGREDVVVLFSDVAGGRETVLPVLIDVELWYPEVVFAVVVVFETPEVEIVLVVLVELCDGTELVVVFAANPHVISSVI